MKELKYDIFISYSTKDKPQVLALVNRLRLKGYRIWIDKDGIRSGDPSFKTTLVEAIESSRIVLFFSSFHSNHSIWTEKEIAIAVNQNKHIIPIKLDGSNYAKSVKFDLINCDFIDYSNESNKETAKEKLFSSLENIFHKKDNGEHHTDLNTELLKIAEVYRKGLGVPCDYEFVATLYDKAASQGNPQAMCNLATLYLKGLGVTTDISLAASLYKMASERGSALATFKLGQMYFKGIFVEQNYNKAILLYQQAASMGCSQAKEELIRLKR